MHKCIDGFHFLKCKSDDDLVWKDVAKKIVVEGEEGRDCWGRTHVCCDRTTDKDHLEKSWLDLGPGFRYEQYSVRYLPHWWATKPHSRTSSWISTPPLWVFFAWIVHVLKQIWRLCQHIFKTFGKKLVKTLWTLWAGCKKPLPANSKVEVRRGGIRHELANVMSY